MSIELWHSCSMNVILETKLFSFILGIEGVQKSHPCGAGGGIFFRETGGSLTHCVFPPVLFHSFSEIPPLCTHSLDGVQTY